MIILMDNLKNRLGQVLMSALLNFQRKLLKDGRSLDEVPSV